MKKENLSIGIHLGRGLENQKYILTKYQDYITSIFLGPPQDLYGMKYTLLSNFYKVLQDTYKDNIDQYKKDLLEISDFAKSLGIKTCFTINTRNLEQIDLNNIKSFVQELIPNQICTRTKYIPFFQNIFDNNYYIRTLYENAKPLNSSDDPGFSGYVVRNTYFYTNSYIAPNKEHRIIINQSCPLTCPGCDGSQIYHEIVFDVEMKKINNSYEEYFARHLWGQEDIQSFKNKFPNINYSFKIGDRILCDPAIFEKYLDLVLTCNSEEIIKAGVNVLSIAQAYDGLWKGDRKEKMKKILETFDFEKYKNLKQQWLHHI